MARLIIHHDDTFIAEVELDRPVLSIGRRPGNDVVLSGDAAVSGSHAQIRVDGSNIVIEDLQSTNGTSVNDAPISSVQLNEDDVVAIGRHRLRIAASAGSEATLILGPEDGLEELAWPDDPEPQKPLGHGRLIDCTDAADATPIALDRSLTTVGNPTEQLAAVAKRKDGYYALCINAGSSTEPMLNQKTLTRTPIQLKTGDVLTVGAHQLRFELEPA